MPDPTEFLAPDDDEDVPEPPDPALTAAIDEIEQRCTKANLKAEEPEEYQGIFIWLQNGQQKRKLFISGLDQARLLLDQPFERFIFLADYDAICLYDEGYIEASTFPFRSSTTFRIRQMFGMKIGESEDRVVKLTPTEESGKVEIELWSSPQKLKYLGPSFRNRRPSLVIRNADVKRHDDAVALLERVANAVFFELDLMYGAPLGLTRDRRPPLLMRPAGAGSAQKKTPSVPNCSYDKEPISLYWYARSATGMPLLQFLAFYQSIEYYLPIYSQNDAIKRLRNLMKDPTFNIHDDGDMSRVLSAIQVSRAGGFGDERSQLRATLQACLDPEELSDFFTSHEGTLQFFTKGEWKSISAQQIPLNNATADLRVNVAERIYDIRNKIVHSKSDGGGKDQFLLPFSKEAEMLDFDIALTQFVSRKVLIANSSKLQL